MKSFYLLLSIALFHSVLSSAQTFPLSGQVRNSQNAPLAYASIQIKGKKQGVSGDENGYFSLPVSAKDILQVSITGYESLEIPVNGQQYLIIVMNSSGTKLEEVVVTALGISRQKRGLGYATQQLDSDELNRAANPNLATALQGKIAGMEIRPSSGMPGASAQVLIRGSRFFDANNAPLYVVDGLPINSEPDFKMTDFGVTGTDYSGRSIDINPADIQSVNILKGQAAAALYGTRASNGAIIITTKRGNRQLAGKPVISFSTNWQADNISRLPDLQSEYAHGSGGAAAHFGSFSWGPAIKDLPDDPVYGGNVANEYNNFNPSSDTRDRYWSPQKNAWVLPRSFNNAKDFFETGLTASNNINISQAGAMGNYAIGLGAVNQQGIIPSSSMDRFNMRFSGDFNASSKVRTGISAFLSSSSIDKIPTGTNSILYQVYGAPPDYDLKGTPYSESSNPYKQISYRGGTFDNPYWATRYNSSNETTRRVLGNTYISYNPFAGLNIRYQLGLDQYTTNVDEYFEMGSAFTGGASFSADIPSDLSPSGGSVLNRTFTNNTVNSLLTLTYNKSLSEKLKMTILAGNEINDNNTRSLLASGQGFSAPGWNNLANTAVQNSAEEKYKSRTIGFFANAQLEWNQMLYLTLTGRNDIISRMPSDSRSFFYPSASLAWIFTELESLKDKGFSGKLRGSYAEVGAPGIFRERVYQRHTAISGYLTDGIEFPFAGVTGYRPANILYDPNIRPQNTVSLELGTELSFFNGRVGIDYSYVKQNTTDQIFSVPLAGSTGYREAVKNGGEMKNTVHEASLMLIPVKSRQFEWSLVANFSKVINKVVSLAPGVENLFLGGFTDPQVRASIGDSYPAIYGAGYQKNEAGDILIDDDASSWTYGMPLPGEATVIGQVTPRFILGVSNSFQYKSFRLSALVDWKNGGEIYSGSNRLIDWYGTSAKTAGRATDELVLKGVKASTVVDNKGGEVNDIILTGSDNFQTYHDLLYNNISEAHVYKSSFVKLRELALSYALSSKLLKSTRFISTASIVVSARNILLWTELPNFDPESSQGNGNMQAGIDYMSLPQTTSMGIGLNLTF